ncbi:MAG: phosphonopyruvate decarboxylase [Chloroflexota bacterium]
MRQFSQPHTNWSQDIYQLFQKFEINLVSYVPDGGLTQLIELCQKDLALKTVSLTTEEEGIALSAGAFLGGTRSALLMQSSGVGNCINMLSLPTTCNMPLLTIITMRGEWGETNPWQVPMGQATRSVLEAMGVIVYRVNAADQVGSTVEAAIGLAFDSRQRVAVLISQKIIGTKKF